MRKINKKIVIYATLITLAVAFLGIYLKTENRIITLESPTPPAQEIVKVAEIGAKITQRDGDEVVALYVKPISDPFTLSAFTIKGVITHSALNPESIIEKNPILGEEAWSFPIFRTSLEESSMGTLAIEVAGFRLGNAPYNVEDENIILYIPIESQLPDEKVSLTLDSENTKLFASDAVTEISY